LTKARADYHKPVIDSGKVSWRKYAAAKANLLIFPFQSLTLIGVSGTIGYGRFNIDGGAYLGSDLVPSLILTIDYKLIGNE